MKPLIKICGIADLNFLNEVIQINEINYLGFIFYENSPRNVTKDLLNEIKIAGFKLGFWFAQQGSIYIFVLLIFIYIRLMNRLDNEYNQKK